jgi:hypothetical protein
MLAKLTPMLNHCGVMLAECALGRGVTPGSVSPLSPVFIPAFSLCLLPVGLVLSGRPSVFPGFPCCLVVFVSSFSGSDRPETACRSLPG